MTTWNDKKEVELANFGEKLVFNLFNDKGYSIAQHTNDMAHPFDMVISRKIKNTWKIRYVEVKTYPALNKYSASGIYLNPYRGYLKLKYPVLLLFVDGRAKEIYGNFLHILDREDAFTAWEERNFSLRKMKLFARINSEDAKKLKELSTVPYGETDYIWEEATEWNK